LNLYTFNQWLNTHTHAHTHSRSPIHAFSSYVKAELSLTRHCPNVLGNSRECPTLRPTNSNVHLAFRLDTRPSNSKWLTTGNWPVPRTEIATQPPSRRPRRPRSRHQSHRRRRKSWRRSSRNTRCDPCYPDTRPISSRPGTPGETNGPPPCRACTTTTCSYRTACTPNGLSRPNTATNR